MPVSTISQIKFKHLNKGQCLTTIYYNLLFPENEDMLLEVYDKLVDLYFA